MRPAAENRLEPAGDKHPPAASHQVKHMPDKKKPFVTPEPKTAAKPAAPKTSATKPATPAATKPASKPVSKPQAGKK
jgi:hypothetical protein